MAILVMEQALPLPEKDVVIFHGDMEMIKRIKNKGLYIDAIKVTRMLTKVSLRSAKEFVDSL